MRFTSFLALALPLAGALPSGSAGPDRNSAQRVGHVVPSQSYSPGQVHSGEKPCQDAPQPAHVAPPTQPDSSGPGPDINTPTSKRPVPEASSTPPPPRKYWPVPSPDLNKPHDNPPASEGYPEPPPRKYWPLPSPDANTPHDNPPASEAYPEPPPRTYSPVPSPHVKPPFGKPSPVQNNTGPGGDYIDSVNYWRKKIGMSTSLEKDKTLEAHALQACVNSDDEEKRAGRPEGTMPQLHHTPSPGEAQVMTFDAGQNFSNVFVGAWLCEINTLPGIGQECEKFKNTWYDDGQTGHAEILKDTSYTKIGCALASTIWTCNLS